MNLLIIIFAFLGFSILLVIANCIYLDKTSPREEHHFDNDESEVKSSISTEKLKENIGNSKILKVFKGVFQLVVSIAIFWLFINLMASTFGTKGAKLPNCTGSGYTKICD